MIAVFPESCTRSQSILSEFSFQPESKIYSVLIFYSTIFIQNTVNRPESYFSVKKHEIFGGVLSYDNMREFFFFFFFFTLRRSKDVIFHETNIHKILLDFWRSRYENATPNLCWVLCALLRVLCNYSHAPSCVAGKFRQFFQRNLVPRGRDPFARSGWQSNADSGNEIAFNVFSWPRCV